MLSGNISIHLYIFHKSFIILLNGRCAKDGAKVVIAAKSAEPHPKLPGTIYTTADEVKSAGGHAHPVICDIRSEDQVKKAIESTVSLWGGIDIVVNNASAISLTETESTPVKKYDLMHQVNARGTWMVSKYALPYLKKSNNAHILMLSPPVSTDPQWFEPHTAYTMAKMGMSFAVLGMAGEFKKYNIAVNALWPKTAIDTAAMAMIPGTAGANSKFRKSTIMADAAYAILCQGSREYTGNFTIDEDIVLSQGIKDLDIYANVPGTKDFFPDFFIPENYTFKHPPKKVLVNATAKL